MIDILLARLRQGHRTLPYPAGEAPLPDRFRGRPRLDPSRCPGDCPAPCLAGCPTGALQRGEGGLRLDQGRCLFCLDCPDLCPHGLLGFEREHRLAARRRDDLVLLGPAQGVPPGTLDDPRRSLLAHSFKLRQVSAGGCNACEADANVLSTLAFDHGRFGIQFVASPRHADALLVTGPVSENMRVALRKTWEALTPPRVVIASGACAIAGGPFAGHPEVHQGVAGLLPVDLFVPGCPPHPLTLLDGLLRLLGRA